MRKLKSLKEHNSNRLKQIWQISGTKLEPVPNGIECPDCGKELFDSNPGQLLLSNPPQHEIHCKYCKYTGTRY